MTSNKSTTPAPPVVCPEHGAEFMRDGRCEALVPNTGRPGKVLREVFCGHVCAPASEPTGEAPHDCLSHSPSGQHWHDWFDRVGEHATVDVVNATANLVIAERKIYANKAATPPVEGWEAATARRIYELHQNCWHQDSEFDEATIAAIIREAHANRRDNQ